jgi:lipoyl synthase
MTTRKLPPWLKIQLSPVTHAANIGEHTYRKGLNTVCREARCPNRAECSSRGEATFLIMGKVCTRNCGFCAVSHGIPEKLNEDEPAKIAESVAAMRLRHVVITSVTRDDLPDGGASHFVACIQAVRSKSPETSIEVLIPDFRGDMKAIHSIVEAAPDVMGHNLETVPRLYPQMRPGASYERSLDLIRTAALRKSKIVIKSGLMAGAGEHVDEIRRVITDLVAAGCKALTIGQYLQPTRHNHAIERFVTPEEFDALKRYAEQAGIAAVIAGPLVRSSFRAFDILEEFRNRVAFTGSCGGTP